MNKPDSLEIAQSAILVVMDRIHKLCLEHKLKYYIIGGTALGAIRHKGFIPWDCDLDIAMPRNDYNLLNDFYSKELEPEFKCVNFKNSKDYYSPHAKIELINSKLVFTEDIYNNINKRKVYIDIMPLDIAPLDIKHQLKQAMTLKRIKKIKYMKRGFIYPHNSSLEKTIKLITKYLLACISWNYLNKKYESTLCLYNGLNSNLICSMTSHYSYQKQLMNKFIYGDPVLYEFENRQYFGPSKIHDYLTKIFNNYMELPSEEEQTKCYNRVCFCNYYL